MKILLNRLRALLTSLSLRASLMVGIIATCGALHSAFTRDSSPLEELKLSELKITQVKPAGAQLMRLRTGLHRLNSYADHAQTAPHIILVHGYKSRGYEWVRPAHQLAQRGVIYFYRWNWNVCPEVGGRQLLSALRELIATRTITELEVYGHSYGGVISSVMAAQYRAEVPLNVHLIAAPLGGHPHLTARCGDELTRLTQPLRADPSPAPLDHLSSASPRLKLHQWRTQHLLDGAFKNLDQDPQIVAWRGEVTRLPTHYRGHRLGHNWSISWVAEQISLRPGAP